MQLGRAETDLLPVKNFIFFQNLLAFADFFVLSRKYSDFAFLIITVHLLRSCLKYNQSGFKLVCLALAHAASRSRIRSDSAVENHGLSRHLTLIFFKGACLLIIRIKLS